MRDPLMPRPDSAPYRLHWGWLRGRRERRAVETRDVVTGLWWRAHG